MQRKHGWAVILVITGLLIHRSPSSLAVQDKSVKGQFEELKKSATTAIMENLKKFGAMAEEAQKKGQKIGAKDLMALREKDKTCEESVRQIVKLGKDNPKDPVAFDCLEWALMYWGTESTTQEIVELIRKDHVKDERLAKIC